MASLRIKFLATSVKMQMHLSVFLPETVAAGSSGSDGLRVLWLLHGEGGDCSDWIRLSMVEHYAQRANIALIMPNLDNSMCMDMAHGGYPYFTYLTEELPQYLHNLVQVLSHRQEDNFVAGVSGGAYGAMKWMLTAPDAFSAAACLSGDIDMVAALRKKEESGTLTDGWIAAFGGSNRLSGTSDDVLQLCRQRAAAHEPLPPIYLSCSENDDSLERNRQAARTLRHMGCEIAWHQEEGEGGWPFWDARIKHFINTVVAPGNGKGT